MREKAVSEGEVSVWGGIAVRERSVCGEVLQ